MSFLFLAGAAFGAHHGVVCVYVGNGPGFAQLGSPVTLISRDSQLASNEDGDISLAILQPKTSRCPKLFAESSNVRVLDSWQREACWVRSVNQNHTRS